MFRSTFSVCRHRLMCTCTSVCVCVCVCLSWLHFADWFIAVPRDRAWEQQSFRVLFSSTTEATNLILFSSFFSNLDFAWDPPPAQTHVSGSHTAASPWHSLLHFPLLRFVSCSRVNQQHVILLIQGPSGLCFTWSRATWTCTSFICGTNECFWGIVDIAGLSVVSDFKMCCVSVHIADCHWKSLQLQQPTQSAKYQTWGVSWRVCWCEHTRGVFLSCASAARSDPLQTPTVAWCVGICLVFAVDLLKINWYLSCIFQHWYTIPAALKRALHRPNNHKSTNRKQRHFRFQIDCYCEFMLLWGMAWGRGRRRWWQRVCVFISLQVFTKTDLFCRYLFMSLNSKIRPLRCYSECQHTVKSTSGQLELLVLDWILHIFGFFSKEIGENCSDQI